MIEIVSQREEGDNIVVKARLPLRALPKLVREPSGTVREVPRAADAGPEDHVVYIPHEAILNRMAFYDLATEAEALDAILREHYRRLNGLPQKPERPWKAMTAAERGEVTGGLDETVTIRRPS